MNLHDPTLSAQMPQPSPLVEDEAERLRVLESFAPDALEDDPELAAIVQFAAKLCNAPVSLVSLVEDTRQRFLAREGLEERETPRDVSFCAHAMLTPELMEVRDATDDPRFADNALVTGDQSIRFYAGQPLISAEGAPLGALCAVDVNPRPEGLSEFQRQGLAVLGQAVMRRLNERRSYLRAQMLLAEREDQLRRMIEGVPQIAWSADAKGNFDYFNARWTEMTGAPPPRLAEEWRPYIHPEDADAVFAEWNRCVSANEEFEIEYRLKTADAGWLWILAQAVPVAERKGDAIRWFGTLTDIDETRQALEERDMLAKELSHRIKNIFAVVTGLAMLKARQKPEHLPFANELTDVLRALGRAHDFARPAGEQGNETLLGLLAAMFAPYTDDAGAPRVHVTGADAIISGRAATPFALVFHELATNSAKYGALSADKGHVELTVTDAGEHMALRWQEIGGPPVKDQGDRGFGSRLVEMSVTGQLRGTWERHFEADGLVVDLTVSKDAIAG